jgi:hypothetical protein
MRLAIVCLALLANLAAASPSTAQSCEPQPELNVDGEGLAFARGIDFDVAGLVSEVLIAVPVGFVRTWVAGQFALDITITSVDGINHLHGSDVVLLSDTVLSTIDSGFQNVVVTWTQDAEPRVINDTYTICSQLVHGLTPLGSEACVDFGPF